MITELNMPNTHGIGTCGKALQHQNHCCVKEAKDLYCGPKYKHLCEIMLILWTKVLALVRDKAFLWTKVQALVRDKIYFVDQSTSMCARKLHDALLGNIIKQRIKTRIISKSQGTRFLS